ncbi:hypothetical protein [Streptodolium elevatio]
MSKIKSLAVAAATAGFTSAAVMFAAPAMAAEANATYSCGAYGTISANFERIGATGLEINATIPGGFTAPSPGSTSITSKLNGTTGPSASLSPGTYGSILLSGTFGTLSSAPSTIQLTASNSAGTTIINCTLSSGGSGWPI